MWREGLLNRDKSLGERTRVVYGYCVNWPVECVVVIPCVDEAGTIFDLVSAARRILPQVIVVDDGSMDETGKLAAKAGAEVIRRETKHGKGAALNAGWQRARERGFTWALTMDGDGQ